MSKKLSSPQDHLGHRIVRILTPGMTPGEESLYRAFDDLCHFFGQAEKLEDLAQKWNGRPQSGIVLLPPIQIDEADWRPQLIQALETLGGITNHLYHGAADIHDRRYRRKYPRTISGGSLPSYRIHEVVVRADEVVEDLLATGADPLRPLVRVRERAERLQHDFGQLCRLLGTPGFRLECDLQQQVDARRAARAGSSSRQRTQVETQEDELLVGQILAAYPDIKKGDLAELLELSSGTIQSMRLWKSQMEKRRVASREKRAVSIDGIDKTRDMRRPGAEN